MRLRNLMLLAVAVTMLCGCAVSAETQARIEAIRVRLESANAVLNAACPAIVADLKIPVNDPARRACELHLQNPLR